MEQTTSIDLEKIKEEIVDLDVNNLKHPEEFKAFALWLSMPPLMRKPPRDKNGNTPTVREFCEQMGIDDEEAIGLISIRTQGEFAEKYGISETTISTWKKAIKKRDIMDDIRVWANELNSNVVFSLYNKTIRGGLPEHYKLWFQVIARWSEKLRVDHRVIRTINFRVVEGPQPVQVIPQTEPEALTTP